VSFSPTFFTAFFDNLSIHTQFLFVELFTLTELTVQKYVIKYCSTMYDDNNFRFVSYMYEERIENISVLSCYLNFDVCKLQQPIIFRIIVQLIH